MHFESPGSSCYDFSWVKGSHAYPSFAGLAKFSYISLTHSPLSHPHPFYCLWRHEFWWSRTTLSATLCRVKRSFKSYQNEHNSVKDTGEKGEKPCNIDQKICMTILFHFPSTFPFINSKVLKAFLKTFPTKIKPTKIMPSVQKKKIEARKAKKDGGWGEERKQKVNVKTAVSLLNPKTILKFCFLHMPEHCKLIFCIWIRRLCTTCKWPYGKS